MTKKRVRTLSAILFLLALLAGLGTTGLPMFHAHAASASVSCASTMRPVNSICGGKSPLSHGCFRHASSFAPSPINNNATHKEVGYVQIRYSRMCQSAWARIVSLQGVVYMLEVNIQIEPIRQPPTGPFAAGESINGKSNVHNAPDLMFTGMIPVSAGTQVLACGTILISQSADPMSSCSSVTI